MSKQEKNKESLPTMNDLLETDNFIDQKQPEAPDENPPVEDESEEEDAAGEKKYIRRSDRPLKNDDGTPYEGQSVRMHREDGKYKGRKKIDVQGLHSKMIPPITRRKFATYEMIGRGTIDPLTNKPCEKVPLILPGSYVVYDPFDEDVMKRHKTLKNVTRFENKVVDGRNVPQEVVEDIIFEDGVLDVPIEKNFLMYVLLELHPLNESNRWRDKSQTSAFRRIDLQARKWGEGSIVDMDLAFEAEKAVVEMKKADEVISYAHAAGIPTANRRTDGDNSIKSDLRIYARNNPRDFFRLNKNNYQAIKISVLDAIELGLIEYEVDKRAWFFATDGVRICTHLPGEDGTDALVKMLQKADYRDKYEELQEQLNYFD